MARPQINPKSVAASIPTEVLTEIAGKSDPHTSSERLANITATTATPSLATELAGDVPPTTDPDPIRALMARMALMEQNQATLESRNRELTATLASKDEQIRLERSRAPYQTVSFGHREKELDPPEDLFIVKEENGKTFVKINAWIPISGATQRKESKPFDFNGEELVFANLNVGSLQVRTSHNTVSLPINGGKPIECSLKGFATIGICLENDGLIRPGGKVQIAAPAAVERQLSGEDEEEPILDEGDEEDISIAEDIRAKETTK